MIDRDREAFETWCKGRHSLKRGDTGFYENDRTDFAWEPWQAARDHYAPKLTEKEAITIAANHISANWKAGHSVAKTSAKKAVDALRAAGVRFKEEA